MISLSSKATVLHLRTRRVLVLPTLVHRRLLYRLDDRILEIDVVWASPTWWRTISAGQAGWWVMPVGPFKVGVRLSW
jgi:hypothetical protein